MPVKLKTTIKKQGHRNMNPFSTFTLPYLSIQPSRWLLFPLLLGALLAGAGLPQASAGTLIRTEQVRATPSASGKVLARLAKGSQIDLLSRQGGWIQINAKGKKGWVRLLSVRGGLSNRGDAAAELRGIAGLTKQSDHTVVAVAGLRGLAEEDLKEARFNAAELKRLDSYQTNRQQAEGFASQGGLIKRDVAYLAPPRGKVKRANQYFEGILP